MSRIDVFRNFPKSQAKNSSELNEHGMRKYTKKSRKSLSDSEIREKLKSKHATKTNTLKKPVKGQKLGESFMNPDKIKPQQTLVKLPQTPAQAQKEQEASTKAIVGDIKTNDPNDTNTTEKLKGLLSAGGFDFSEKEKETLGKILGN